MTVERARRLAGWGAVLAGAVSAALVVARPVMAQTPVAPSAGLELPLPQARQVALQAAFAGRTDVALRLTDALLRKDQTDTAAHLARGTAFLGARAYGAAYRGGRLAFRHADTDANKYEAARIAATAAFGGQKPLLAQYWMRRAGDFAQTPVQRTRVEQQFRVIQAKTPLHFRFTASVMPSSNVNGGSESAYNLIDGVPYIGVLSADARALSGYIAQTNVHGSLRIAETGTRRTQIEGSFYTKRVGLSDEAKATAPNFDPDILGVTSAGLGLRHSFTTGAEGPMLSVRGGLRGYWQGGTQAYRALTAGVDVQHKISPRLTFSGALGLETRDYDGEREGELRTASLGLSYRFANGNRLSGALFAQDSVLPQQVFSSDAVSARLSFALGQPVLGGVLLSGGLGISQRDYPDFTLGLLPVPGGRQDDALFADLEARFTQLEFAGFSPSVRLRRTETSSNVSRYTTSEWAVSLGIQSNF